MVDDEAKGMKRRYCLIVDNNPEHQELAALVLKEIQIEAGLCEFGADCWDRILAEKPSVLILDLELGNGDCWTLLDRILTTPETKMTPIICLSTDVDLLEKAQAVCSFPAGSRFIQKPYDIHELEGAVVELMSGNRATRERANSSKTPSD
jgi:CheY-like chemotaxis protein